MLVHKTRIAVKCPEPVGVTDIGPTGIRRSVSAVLNALRIHEYTRIVLRVSDVEFEIAHKLITEIVVARAIIVESLVPRSRPIEGVWHFGKSRRRIPRQVVVIVHGSLFIACTFLRGYEHHTESCSGTIYRCCRSIFEHGNILDILRIHKRQVRYFHAVEEYEGTSTIERCVTSDVYFSLLTRLSTVEGDVQIGYHALQSLCDVSNRPVRKHLS